MITQEEVKEILNYDPETGIFTWKLTTCPRLRFGDIAGSLKKSGYIEIHISNKIYQAHRLAWIYMHGVQPSREIDHINRVRNDNRLLNLRLATDLQQANNREPHFNSQGYSGIRFQNGKYVSRMMIEYEEMYLGYFENPEFANLVYTETKRRYHENKPFLTPRGVVVRGFKHA